MYMYSKWDLHRLSIVEVRNLHAIRLCKVIDKRDLLFCLGCRNRNCQRLRFATGRNARCTENTSNLEIRLK